MTWILLRGGPRATQVLNLTEGYDELPDVLDLVPEDRGAYHRDTARRPEVWPRYTWAVIA